MFAAALFIMAKTWKQHMCLPTEDVIHITMEYYSAKQNEITPFAATQIAREIIKT